MKHSPHSPATDTAIDQYLLPAGPAAAKLVCCCETILGHTDGWTTYCFIDPAPHTLQAVPIKWQPVNYNCPCVCKAKHTMSLELELFVCANSKAHSVFKSTQLFLSSSLSFQYFALLIFLPSQTLAAAFVSPH